LAANIISKCGFIDQVEEKDPYRFLNISLERVIIRISTEKKKSENFETVFVLSSPQGESQWIARSTQATYSGTASQHRRKGSSKMSVTYNQYRRQTLYLPISLVFNFYGIDQDLLFFNFVHTVRQYKMLAPKGSYCTLHWGGCQWQSFRTMEVSPSKGICFGNRHDN
jgi:hypothetical protein